MESTVATTTASPLAVLRPGSLTAYWRFQRAVAKAQLAAWLPAGRRLLVDISGPGTAAAQAAGAGHAVVRVVTAHPGPPTAAWRAPPGRMAPPGPVAPVVAEAGSLAFLADGCADGVIAEGGALSRQLMAEDLAAEIARVLRPGGELLASVDSLVLGMAILAEQRHWAHLTDLPHAEVVLIPWPDGTITRCYGDEHLRELFTGCWLEVSWIRPRTVFSPQTVSYLLARDPSRFGELVNAELRARSDDSVGTQLIACAVLPPGTTAR